MEVRTAVVPAAGFGTRFLPATKTVPKEMLPLLDRPVLHYVLEEATAAGLDRLVLVGSREKQAMEDYLDRSPELEHVLAEKGRSCVLEDTRRLAASLSTSYVRQPDQLGLGHAVLMAREAAGPGPVAVLLPDDIVQSDEPAIGQLLAASRRHGASVVGVEEVSPEQVPSYGIVRPEPVEEGLYRVRGVVEKPRPEEAPSSLGIVGRYVFAPQIFDCLEQTSPGAGGEIQLTDAIDRLARDRPVYALRLHGERFDTGTPLGLLRASLAFALQRDDMASSVREWMRRLL